MTGTNASEEVVLHTDQQSIQEWPTDDCSLNKRRLLLPTLQKREESLGQSKIAQVVCGEFCLNHIDIDGLGLRKVDSSLNARIQYDAVEIGVGFGDTSSSEYQASETFIQKLTW